MLEALFAVVVGIGLPLRAWRRYRRGAPPAPALHYLVETTVLIAALGALLWRRGVTAEALALWPASGVAFLAHVALGLAVIAGPDAWTVWRLTHEPKRAGALPAPTGLAADALAGGQVGWRFLAVTIVGAIWEELCFRGAARLLAPATAAGAVLGLSGSLAFGAQHLRGGPSAAMYASFFGAVFYALFLVTNDLAAVMVAHAAGNILTAWQWAPRIERARRAAQRSAAPMFLG